MSYEKPEIIFLGDAARVVQDPLKPGGTETEGGPAYDLDE